MNNRPGIEYWLGIILILSIVPLTFLFNSEIGSSHPLLYFIQIGLMIIYLIVELLLDYVLRIEFRQIRWIVIPYSMLFLAATGGMIGVASHAGKNWLIAAIVSYLLMAAATIFSHIFPPNNQGF
jgi:hypothetical protein